MKDETTEGAPGRRDLGESTEEPENVDPPAALPSSEGHEARDGEKRLVSSGTPIDRQASEAAEASEATEPSEASEAAEASEATEPSEAAEASADVASAERAGADSRARSTSSASKSGVAKWAFLAVPLVAIAELVAHVVQTRDVVSEADWASARDVAAKKLGADDLLLFAPKWEDPVGRAVFGDKLASLERTARPDETRFPRAIEVSARGKHRPELSAWRLVEETKVGRLVVGTYENPHPAKVIDDLRLRVSPEKMAVFRVDGANEVPCPFVLGRTSAGGLGAGPAVPGDRFQCPGGSFVGASVIHALDHDPRACLFAPPFGSTSVLRVRFRNVRFGTALHGHHGLQNEAERDKIGAPVTITFRTERGLIGPATHKDGMGFTRFELQTGELAGASLDLVADITAANGNRRHYCFEADTR